MMAVLTFEPKWKVTCVAVEMRFVCGRWEVPNLNRGWYHFSWLEFLWFCLVCAQKFWLHCKWFIRTFTLVWWPYHLHKWPHMLALPSSQMATFCFTSVLWYCFSYERYYRITGFTWGHSWLTFGMLRQVPTHNLCAPHTCMNHVDLM